VTRNRSLLIGVILALAAVAVSVWAYPLLPDRVPTHWDIDGNPNAYSSRLAASILTPGIIGVLWVFMLLLPAISPRGFQLGESAGVFYTAMLAVIGFSLVMHVMLIRAALTDGRPSMTLLFAAIGILLAIIGMLLGKVKKNFWFGVRTPWTLASDEIWLRTNRLAGRLFVAGGIIIALASFAGKIAIGVLIAVVSAVAAFSIVYSYVIYRRIEGFGSD
jgi:immunity protein, SdpI family